MKVLITGATGLLGRAVYKLLASRDYLDVTGIGFSRAEPPLQKLNLTEKEALIKFMEENKTDLVVHCAAERRPDVSEAEPEASEYLNVEVTRNLADISKSLGCRMIYISTDYVFDGTNPPYYTDSPTNPLNFYGKTKLAGEAAVREVLKNFIILRVPILYGTELYPLESSIGSISAALSEKRGGAFDDLAIRYPTHTEDVASVLDRMISTISTGGEVTGIYHFSGHEALTKYKMALIMAGYMGIDKKNISPDKTDTGSTVRPENSHLESDSSGSVVSVPERSFRDGIVPMLKRLYKELV